MTHPLLEFGEHMAASGGPIECGETWSPEHRWRCYMKAGTKVIMMPPRTMRKMGEKYRDHQNAPADVRDLGLTMIECANAAKDKNARGVVPDGAAAMIPHAGRA